MTITESIKFDKLQAENEALKKELTEKEKEIEGRIIEYRDLIVAYEELKHQQLFKEDFTKEKILQGFDLRRGLVDTFTNGYVLKDNSKYDKLPSKDVK